MRSQGTPAFCERSSPSGLDSPAEALNVVCVCGGYGFPYGTASGARIAIVGRALMLGGASFRLIHCGPSPVEINRRHSGVHEGIRFEYTTPTRRPEGRVARHITYFSGALGLIVRLARLRSERASTVIYLYVIDGALNILASISCRVLGLPVVQELCEWPPGEPGCSKFTEWLYRAPIYKLATASLVISREIECRVRERARVANPDLLVYRLPSIVDPAKFEGQGLRPDIESPTIPAFVYCGTWLRDVSFMVRAFRRVADQGYECRLRLIGGWAKESMREIRKVVAANGLTQDRVELPGCVDEATLGESYRNAAALLMPLWNDDRSITRLPNKMGEYLASGRPIITSAVGDLTEFLFDRVNAYVASPGDETDFADRMAAVLARPEDARRIGLAGRVAGRRHLDYEQHATSLVRFFRFCVDWRGELALRERSKRFTVRALCALRHAACRILAYGVIASGAVRRAKTRAFEEGVVTAVYFHKPNRRLFERSLKWLEHSGYAFISDSQLADFLQRKTPLPKGAVWLSFDDACKELMENVIPVVQERRIPITLYVPTGILEGDGLFPWVPHSRSTLSSLDYFVEPHASRDALTIDDLRLLARMPEVSIGSHNVNHAYTDEVDANQCRKDIANSKRCLETLLEAPVRSFAYPGGRFNRSERNNLIASGYDFAVTTQNSFVDATADPYYVPRFSVADSISIAEAVCNMVGIWRPLADPLRRLLGLNNESGASSRPSD